MSSSSVCHYYSYSSAQWMNFGHDSKEMKEIIVEMISHRRINLMNGNPSHNIICHIFTSLSNIAHQSFVLCICVELTKNVRSTQLWPNNNGGNFIHLSEKGTIRRRSWKRWPSNECAAAISIHRWVQCVNVWDVLLHFEHYNCDLPFTGVVTQKALYTRHCHPSLMDETKKFRWEKTLTHNIQFHLENGTVFWWNARFLFQYLRCLFFSPFSVSDKRTKFLF